MTQVKWKHCITDWPGWSKWQKELGIETWYSLLCFFLLWQIPKTLQQEIFIKANFKLLFFLRFGHTGRKTYELLHFWQYLLTILLGTPVYIHILELFQLANAVASVPKKSLVWVFQKTPGNLPSTQNSLTKITKMYMKNQIRPK